MQKGNHMNLAPFNTNTGWNEEIALGPGPPRKKKDMERQRRRGRDSVEGSQRDLTTGSSARTGTSSADTVVAKNSTEGASEVEQEERGGDDWNRKRYQREDELLWGMDSDYDDEPGDQNYYIARNPPVNDLHPPVVSTQPTHRSETKWMLQPPPSARIMEGKERANRARSGSGGSNGSNGSSRREVGLGRQLGERMMEEKRRKGQAPEARPRMSRGTSYESRSSSNTTQGQRHDRDQYPSRASNESRSSTESLSKPKRAVLPSSINIPTDDSNSSTLSLRATATTNTHAIPTKPPPQVSLTNPTADDLLPQRPPLQTIISSANVSKAHPSPTSTLLRPSILQTPSASSLRALQELISPSTALNTCRPLSVPPAAVMDVGLPPPDENEDRELILPEVESLWPVDGLREWEFTDAGRRSKRQRWSMDI
ncbi:MAG: hypothetical protein Q9201_005463 [Fulgogasparrea decipioides]